MEVGMSDPAEDLALRTHKARTSGYSVSTTWTASDVLPLQACSIHLQSHPLHSAPT